MLHTQHLSDFIQPVPAWLIFSVSLWSARASFTFLVTAFSGLLLVKLVKATAFLFFYPLLILSTFLSSPSPSHSMVFNFSSFLGVPSLSPALFTGLLLSQPGSFPLSALPQPFPPEMPPPALHRGCLPSSQEETDWHTAWISHLKGKAHHPVCTSCRLL